MERSDKPCLHTIDPTEEGALDLWIGLPLMDAVFVCRGPQGSGMRKSSLRRYKCIRHLKGGGSEKKVEAHSDEKREAFWDLCFKIIRLYL
eukprot:scaffold237658_cov60-Attheya_sp.AAC.1